MYNFMWKDAVSTAERLFRFKVQGSFISYYLHKISIERKV